MSRSGICDMLHRWGFTYTRPTYRLQKTDPLRQKQFLQELDWIKKLIR
ncbi:winged helix-turn-helix domain-containing protein [Bacillus thuringiensis]|nr:winged helix-turn-helix domain-containing protein [Bacillus thuringiensis]